MDTKVTSRRRWFRFTLRTWLVAATALCLWLGWWSQSSLRQKRAVERLTALGITVRYDDRETGRSYAVSDWIGALVGIDFVRTATTIFQSNAIDRHQRDVVIATLPELPQLRSVHLDAPDVTDDDLRQLCNIRQLQNLFMLGSAITDIGIEPLRNLSRLESLGLNRTHITPHAARVIAQLSNLETVYMMECNLNDEVLRQIGTMTRLRILGLAGSTGITDDNLKQVAALKELRLLDIAGTEVGETGLDCLVGLSQLKHIFVDHGNDPARFQTFRSARPDCRLRSN